jgi:hypothetical protein
LITVFTKLITKQALTGKLFSRELCLFLQVYRRAVRKVFEFNLMVVGESGLGKEREQK